LGELIITRHLDLMARGGAIDRDAGQVVVQILQAAQQQAVEQQHQHHAGSQPGQCRGASAAFGKGGRRGAGGAGGTGVDSRMR